MAGQQVPIMKKEVAPDYTTAPAAYTQSFDNAALTPTALGEFGSQLAITASTTLAQKRGYEAGKDPHGTLLPPMTKADQAYANAYITQAQNTLGLQANKLMQEGQQELAKAWKLTPDMIASYTKNMSEGLNDIINNAPLQAQPGLAAQFNSSLMNSSGQLNMKMIGQQKTQALQNASLFNNTQLSAMYEAARSGNYDAAEKMQQDMLARTNSMKASGMITPLQAEATEKSARMSLYTGLYSGQAVQAFQNKTSDQFLSDLLAKKPEGMNTLEWEGISRNVMGEVALQESFQQRNETSLYSEANRLLNEGTLTPDFISQLEAESTSKPRFNNFMAQVASYQRKNFKTNQQVSNLMPQWNSPYAMAVASNKTKNAALIQAAGDVQQRAASSGRQLDDFEAEAEAMATAGGPIQDFTHQMNAGFLSGNPDLMLRNLNAYRALRNSNPKALNGMDKKAEAMMTNFESQMEDGNAPDVAAQKATEIVQQKTPEQMEINTALVRQWENSKVNTPSRLNSWASQFADLGDGAKINNLPYFAIHAKNIFKSNMEYLNGDVEGATKMTREGIERAWGVTEINGKQEFVFQPIEQTIGLDSGANPLIKHDLYEQIQKQIAPMNAAYEEGVKNKDSRISFFYRLAPRPSYEDFRNAQATIAKISKEPHSHTGFSGAPLSPMPGNVPVNKEWDDAINLVNSFKNDPIKIERVYQGGKRVESFTMAIAANPGLQQDANGTIGSYNVSMRMGDGPSAPMNGWFAGPLSEPVYLPNSKQIHDRYFELVGLNPSGMTAYQMNQERIAKKARRAEAGVDETISHLGRSFR
jgi:hypothetical protein